jgi:anti-sigma factor RsiW
MKHVTEIQLIEYTNGSVDGPQKAAIKDHLAGCAACRRLYEQTKLVYDSLDDLAAPQVNDLTARVRQGVAAAGGWRNMYTLTRAAAVIIIAVLAGYFTAIIFAPVPQSDSVSILKAQSEISFTQPARHIALAVSGEAR